MNQEHYSFLEKLFFKAPTNGYYDNISISVFDRGAELTLPVKDKYFHGGGAVHGSHYFKLLDDAAYFAIASIVTDFFIVTTDFRIDLLRPINQGELIARGKIIQAGRSVFIAESEIRNNGKLAAIGRGSFMKTKTPISSL